MTSKELLLFYNDKVARIGGDLKMITRKINLISNARLLVALIFILLFIFAFRNDTLFYFLPVVLIVFVILVQKHSREFNKRSHLQNLLSIQQKELEALGGNYSSFDTGARFTDTHHPYSHDLDIFGDGSLFQMLNRCNTGEGKELLARRLSDKLFSVEEILEQQRAVADLAEKVEFRHEIQASGMEMEEQPDDRRQLLEWSDHGSFLYGKIFYRIVLNGFPLITLSLLILLFFIDGLALFFWVSAAMQWLFLGFHLKSVNAFHQYVSKKHNVLDRYGRLLLIIEKENFSSELLAGFALNARDAHRKLGRFSSLVRALDARMNSMTNLVFNSLLLYDLQCIYRLESWKEKNAARLTQWFDTISRTEALCSLGTFSFNNPDFVFPSINTERKLHALSLGHPLISREELVVNDVKLDGEVSVMIITGANMAGKSTFLRTVGVNVVLALSGAPVCAKSFDCPFIGLRSGMRTADSLRDHASYFYAELNRLKAIVDELRSGKELLILLDEILKGTNSTDKQAGSIALVKQLTEHKCIALIATHDLVLGEMEKEFPSKIHNYCFEPEIMDDQLSFSYLLNRGIARKMNATFLMKKMGIIPSLSF